MRFYYLAADSKGWGMCCCSLRATGHTGHLNPFKSVKSRAQLFDHISYPSVLSSHTLLVAAVLDRDKTSLSDRKSCWIPLLWTAAMWKEVALWRRHGFAIMRWHCMKPLLYLLLAVYCLLSQTDTKSDITCRSAVLELGSFRNWGCCFSLTQFLVGAGPLLAGVSEET